MEKVKSEEQLPQKTVGRLTVGRPLTNSWPTVVYRLLRKFFANSRLTVGRLLADCWPTVSSMSVMCQLSVG